MTRRRLVSLACFALFVRSVGAARAVEMPEGYRTDNYHAPTPDAVPGGVVVHTAAVRALADEGRAILIDVLPAPRRPDGIKPGAPWMPLPRMDLPGSVWLPDVGRGALDAVTEAWFRNQLAELTGGDLARALVFYCMTDCWMSWNAAKRAASYGYTRVLWYPEGADGWQSSGGALASNRARTPPEPMPKNPVSQPSLEAPQPAPSKPQ